MCSAMSDSPVSRPDSVARFGVEPDRLLQEER